METKLEIVYLKLADLRPYEKNARKHEPLAIYIDSDKGHIYPAKGLYRRCIPSNIIKELNLREVDFEKLAQFGHFTS